MSLNIPLNSRYKLLIFDWDGTLMDSSVKIINCFNGAAEDMELPRPDAGQVKNLIGLSLAEAFSRLYPDLSLIVGRQQYATQISRLVACYKAHWLFHDSTPMSLFPAVREGLKRLDERGYLLSIATGKSHQGLIRAMEETDLNSLFVYTRCADQSRPKPDPQMLFDILSYTGLDQSEVIMIGDTIFDLQMAQNAGVNGWGVSYGSHSHQELQPLSAHPVQSGFSGLVDLL